MRILSRLTPMGVILLQLAKAVLNLEALHREGNFLRIRLPESPAIIPHNEFSPSANKNGIYLGIIGAML